MQIVLISTIESICLPTQLLKKTYQNININWQITQGNLVKQCSHLFSKRNRNLEDFTFPPLNMMAVRPLAHDRTIMPSDEVLGKIVYVYK